MKWWQWGIIVFFFLIMNAPTPKYKMFLPLPLKNDNNSEMDIPLLIFRGSLNENLIAVKYSNNVDENAEKIHLMVYFVLQKLQQQRSGFVKISNSKTFHYNKIGLSSKDQPSRFSQSFEMTADKDKLLLIEVENSLVGANFKMQLFLTGYSK